MADNKYRQSLETIKQEFSQLLGMMDQADKKLLKMLDTLQKVGSGMKAVTPEGLSGVANEYEKGIKKASGAAKELVGLQEKITRRRTINALKLQAESNNQLISSYERLIAQQKRMKAELGRLRTTLGENHEQTKRLQAAYDKVTKSVGNTKNAFNNLAKGSLRGIIKGFRNLLGAFGIAGGITFFAQLSKDIFNLTKKIESLNFALQVVTDTTVEYAKVNDFLIDISNRYGASIITTTERYTKFLAAAKQSNLSLTDTERIFEAVTKASGVLGLRTDELTGVYLALEQMLSKGKVTTEELRRQLGERLPGAFGIMADALGVSISQLDKMLKKGEVLSGEALPKFAEQLQIAYGIEAVQTIDTLVAAQTRLSNKWVEFVESITKDGSLLKSTFTGILNFLSGVLSAIKEISDDIRDAFESDAVKAVRKEFEQFAKVTQDQIDSLNTIEQTQRRYNAALEESFALQDNLARKLRETGDFNAAQADEAAKALIDLAGSTKSYNEFLEESTDIIDRNDILSKDLLATTFARIQGINQVIKATSDQIESENELNEELDDRIIALKGSIVFMEQFIKKLEEKQGKLARTSAEYREYGQAIEAAKEKLDELRRELANPKLELSIKPDFELADPFKFFDEQAQRAKEINDDLEAYQEQKRKEALAKEKTHAQQRIAIAKEVFDTFGEFYDLDFDKYEFLFDGKENTLQDWQGAAKETIDGVLDATLQRYQIELQEAQAARDLIINNELATEKEKRLARQKFEEEERRIKTRQARAERRNTLIKIATDTASGVISALAQIPKFDFGISATAFAAFIAASGAAQAALVAAQPLPRFAKGTTAPLTKNTLAWVGDGGKSEAITLGGQLLGVTPDKPTLMGLPKGGEVQPDAEKWLNEQIFNMNMMSQGRTLNDNVVDNAMITQLKGMRDDAQRTWGEVKTLANRPINVKVVNEVPYDEYHQ